MDPVPRFRFPFDPIFDLSSVRATYALVRARQIKPADFMTLMLLSIEYRNRGMDEAELEVLEALLQLRPINRLQQGQQQEAEGRMAELRMRLSDAPEPRWENLSELDRRVSAMLASGRARSAADLLERAYPADGRPWEVTDRAAALRLHLGQPAEARALWERAGSPPRPAVRAARVALTFLVEGDFAAARKRYREALEADPHLFEAHYSLAVLEEDAGNAAAALDAGRHAEREARGDVALAAAQRIGSDVARFARP
jgi:tetratricopeptide (TPR) repeat protein